MIVKKLKLTSVIAGVILSLFLSCNDKPEKESSVSEGVENNDKASNDDRKGPPPNRDRKGPPPNGDGDRKGPPRGLPEQTKTLEEIGAYKIGDTAEDFSLKSVDGSTASLASVNDAKGYIVVFTCNECPFSKLYEDRLIALHNDYAPKGYPVIAINSNGSKTGEDFESMKKRAEEKRFPFKYAIDKEQIYSKKYGAVRTPHVFLLDKDYKVQYIGAIDDNSRSADNVKEKYVENAISALEAGKLPDPNYTKAIGCPISH